MKILYFYTGEYDSGLIIFFYGHIKLLLYIQIFVQLFANRESRKHTTLHHSHANARFGIAALYAHRFCLDRRLILDTGCYGNNANQRSVLRRITV